MRAFWAVFLAAFASASTSFLSFFAAFFVFFFSDVPLLAPTKLSTAAISVASDRWAYQTSIVVISANSAIATR